MKKFLSSILAVIIVVSTIFCIAVPAFAATISSNKHTATGVKGGQTVYITSNTGWNTELPGGAYRTKVQITLPKAYFEYFQYNLTTAKYAKMKVEIYKKSGSSWSLYSSGTYNCNNKGVLSQNATAKTFELPGKGVNYKIKLTPVVKDPVSSYCGSKAANYTNIKVAITSYGTITSVS